MNGSEPQKRDREALVLARVELGEDAPIPLHPGGGYVIEGKGVEAQRPEDAMGKRLGVLLTELKRGFGVLLTTDLKPAMGSVSLLGPAVGTYLSLQAGKLCATEAIVEIPVGDVEWFVP